LARKFFIEAQAATCVPSTREVLVVGRGRARLGNGDHRTRSGPDNDRAPFAGIAPPHADKAHEVRVHRRSARPQRHAAHCQTPSNRTSAIDARTTRHPAYAISQRQQTIDRLARPMLGGVARLRFKFTLTMAAYDLIRLPNLLGSPA